MIGDLSVICTGMFVMGRKKAIHGLCRLFSRGWYVMLNVYDRLMWGRIGALKGGMEMVYQEALL